MTTSASPPDSSPAPSGSSPPDTPSASHAPPAPPQSPPKQDPAIPPEQDAEVPRRQEGGTGQPSPAGAPALQPGLILQPGAGPGPGKSAASDTPPSPSPQEAPLPIGARWSILAATALTIAVADLWSKQWAFARLAEDGQSEEVWRGVLHWTRHLNTGVVWGMGQGNNRLFTWISTLAIPVILFIYSRMRGARLSETIGLGLILGGTIGNLYDRFVHGAVRDFIHVVIINWPVFNVADAAICTGAGLVAIGLLRAPQESPAGRRPV